MAERDKKGEAYACAYCKKIKAHIGNGIGSNHGLG